MPNPTTIDELSIEIDAKAKSADSAIDGLCEKLDSLITSISKVDVGKLNSLASGIQRLGAATKAIQSIDKRSFTSVATKIKELSAIDTSKFATVSANLHQMANGINSLGAVSSNLSRITSFANGISKLSEVDISNLRSVSSAMPNIVQSLNGMGPVSANAVEVGNLANNISKLGSKSVQTAVTNIPQLATALNGLMGTLSQAPKVSQNVIDMTNALANLSAQGSKVGSASNSIVKGLNKASTSATRARGSFKGLASAFGKFYANCFLVIRGVKSLWNSINSTADYLEAFNYFEVALNKVGGAWASDWEKYSEKLGVTSAEEYANSFKTRLNENLKGLSGVQISVDADGKTGLLTDTGMKNLGLNIQEVTQYASQLASVTNSVGQTGEVTLATASAFTKLGADMSSLFNVDYSSVMNNLQSGLIGQSRALYKYGIDITNATLQTYAYKVGVTKAVSEMTQAEKMQLRMIAILDQSRVSWGDQANTINSLSNSIRQFKNNISEAGQILGQLFVPILSKVMPIVNGLTIAIKRLMVSVAGLLGIKLDLSEFGQGTSNLEDSIGDVTDAYDDATTAAQKFKTTSLGIDELNINSPKEDTSSGITGNVGGGLDLTDSILKATEEYEKAWKEAYDRMENQAIAFADRIEKALEPIKKIFQDFAVGDYFQAGQDVSNLVVSINNFFAKAIDEVDWYGIGTKIGEFLKGVDWTEVLSSVGKLIWEAIKAGIETWEGAFNAAPIETTITTGIMLLNFSGIGLLIFGKIKTAIVNDFKLIFGNIWNFLPFATANMGTASFDVIADEAIRLLNLALEELLPDWALDFLAKVGSGLVLGAAAGSWFPGAGTIVGAIIGGILGAIDSIEIDGISILKRIVDKIFNFDSTKMFFSEAKNAFEKAFSGETNNFLEIGAWILDGIMLGFTGALQFIIEPIQDFFSWVVEKICDVFGIHSPAKEMKPIGENIFLGIVEGFSSLFDSFTTKISYFWDEYVKPWFTKEKWTNLLSPIVDSFKSVFKNAANGVIGIFNKLIGWINEKMSFSWDAFNIAGKEIFPAGSIQLFTIPEIPKFKNGGFVEPNLPGRYSVLMAGEDGIPEIAGTVGGKPAVAGGAEITGISNAVYATSEEEIRELKEMNGLLRQLLEKDVSVNIGDREIYKASIRGSKSYGKVLIT